MMPITSTPSLMAGQNDTRSEAQARVANCYLAYVVGDRVMTESFLRAPSSFMARKTYAAMRGLDILAVVAIRQWGK